MAEERSYVVLATMPWDGPWNVEHHLAHALALRHRVLFVDPPLSPLTPFRFGVGRRSWPRLRALVARGVRPCGRLQVTSPVALPPVSHPLARRLSRPLFRAQVARSTRRAGHDRPVVVALRSLAELSGATDERFRVFMIIDRLQAGAHLVGLDVDAIEQELAADCAAADLVCVTSHELQETVTAEGQPCELLLHGFQDDLAPLYDAAAEPPEYQRLPRPILGYTGTVDDRLDLEQILALATRFERGSVVFVGPVSPRLSGDVRTALEARDNVHLLGPRPREALPAYTRWLDCAVLPYLEGEWAQHGSPLKLWEYFYAGPPIVGTGYVSLRRYPPPLAHFTTAAAAPEVVARVLQRPEDGREQRRAFALANTWTARAERLDALVAQRLVQPKNG